MTWIFQLGHVFFWARPTARHSGSISCGGRGKGANFVWWAVGRGCGREAGVGVNCHKGRTAELKLILTMGSSEIGRMRVI